MAFLLKNGKYSVQIKFDEHVYKGIKDSFSYTDKNTSEIKTVKKIGIRLKLKGEKNCYIKVPEGDLRHASGEKEVKNSNPTMNLILDDTADYDIFTKIQSEERKVASIKGFQVIKYFDDLERERKAYIENEANLNKKKQLEFKKVIKVD